MPNGTMSWSAIPYQRFPIQGYTVKESPLVIQINY